MKDVEKVGYIGWCRNKAHEEIDYIFQELMPKHGLNVREEQLRLSHEMLDSLWGKQIALCDAGVGIGKTYAYLIACIMLDKYGEKGGSLSKPDCHPAVISTSSIALQDAILKEYIPFLSRILLEEKLIRKPLKAVVRKGKEHFVCDQRLEQRLSAISGKRKNEGQKKALLSLRSCYDMDQVHGLSGFDRRLVCVLKFCPKNCPGREACRYRRYMERVKGTGIHFQICNHNYLLADASHRAKGYRPLLSDYRALVIDEAHKLPEAAGQMCGKSLCSDDIQEICYMLEKEHQGIRAGLKILCYFLVPSRKYILYLEQDGERLPVFCATNRRVPAYLDKMLWEQGVPSILTSGTLKAGNGFLRTRQMLGLEETNRKRKTGVQEYVAESPFEYKRNCLLYLPQNGKQFRHGSREEAVWIAKQIKQLTCSSHGHTLVLFTSYSLMGSVYQLLRGCLPYTMVEVWRHTQEEIMRFKNLGNAVLFAAGSCWEGVDFPGDMVSSLIIVRLPFAVPDPVREAEKEQYGSLRKYIEAVAVPDMQKKLRQEFGRAIRTETDTCVVTILDQRAARGGRYYEDVLCALPSCQMAESMEDVERFIRRRKNMDYYM